MTQHHPISSEKKETEQLLVSSILGDATAEQINRLNDLLQSDAELRSLAARFLEEETVLRHQFQMLGRVSDYHNGNLLVEVREASNQITSAASRTCAGTSALKTRRAVPFFIVASLLTILACGSLWITRPWGNTGSRPIAEEHFSWPIKMDPKGDSLTASHSAALPLAASMLPRVTKVSWAGPQFASHVEGGPLATAIHSGVIPFTSAFGRPAQGNMVHLPPNAQLDLVVAADAEGENALAVIEFNSDGKPTGRRITYSNSAAEVGSATKPPSMTKHGPLGIWTERNNSSKSKYYFFTSVHKLLNRSIDDTWHVSRLLVLLDESNLVHIGWDDSGMIRDNDRDYAHLPDDDFDDLSATIRITKGEEHAGGKAADIRVLPEYDSAQISENAPSISREQVGFNFSIPAGESLILKATCRAHRPIALTVLDKKTGRLQWSCQHMNPSTPNVGICAIENDSAELQEFQLLGWYKTTATTTGDTSESWRESFATVRFQQDGFTTLTIDNGLPNPEYNHVKVDIITLGNL